MFTFLLIVIVIICLFLFPEITIVALLIGLAIYFWQISLIIIVLLVVGFIIINLFKYFFKLIIFAFTANKHNTTTILEQQYIPKPVQNLPDNVEYKEDFKKNQKKKDFLWLVLDFTVKMIAFLLAFLLLGFIKFYFIKY